MRQSLNPLRVGTLLVLCLFGSAPAYAQRAVILVRHAEKVDNSKDAALSPAGEQRAAALAKMLADAGVTSIYTSQYQRTIRTAEPLARLLKIRPESGTIATGELVARLKRDHAQGVVLVVGHSDSVPAIIKALGAGEPITIGDTDYSNLFIVTPRDGAAPVLLRLRY